MNAPGWWSWSADPGYVVFLATVIGVYIVLYRRATDAPGPDPSWKQWVPFAAGTVTLIVSFLSPLAEIGEDWLISAHMLQHVLAADLAPALLVLGLRSPIVPLGLPKELLRVVAHRGPLGRVWGVLTRPWVAVPIWALCQWIWAWPAVFDAAAGSTALHAVEHATLFYSGVLLWWTVVDPLPTEQRQPRGERLAVLGASRVVAAVVCVPLTWMESSVYDRYADAPRAYGLSAIQDQQIAGGAMCILEILVFGIAFVAVFVGFLGRVEREDALRDRLQAGAEHR